MSELQVLRQQNYFGSIGLVFAENLSEKSRLRILHFLRDEPHSFIEVVRHLGISKGITHDHIFNLRSAGLLSAHVVGETVSAYSLRLDRIQQIEHELLDYLKLTIHH